MNSKPYFTEKTIWQRNQETREIRIQANFGIKKSKLYSLLQHQKEKYASKD
jgi:hypothetical protein